MWALIRMTLVHVGTNKNDSSTMRALKRMTLVRVHTNKNPQAHLRTTEIASKDKILRPEVKQEVTPCDTPTSEEIIWSQRLRPYVQRSPD